MAAPIKPCDVKILLANSEPSTHGTFATWVNAKGMAAFVTKADADGLVFIAATEGTWAHPWPLGAARG